MPASPLPGKGARWSADMSLPAEMEFVDVPQPGGPEVLRLARRPLPAPGRGEVLIRVAAAGVNAPDLQQRRGRYDPPPGASPILGLEVGGEIAALGDGARRFAPGQPVVALTNGGGYAEYVAVPEGQVLPVPEGWSGADAAALPETFFTIEQTLVMRAGLSAGMHVLVHGGAGGIGGAAISIARLQGARPIAVVSSPEKAAYARALGAVATIDRRHEDLVSRTRELTDGRGAERIVDIVGSETMAHNLEAAAVEGIILQLATLAGGRAEINAGLIVGKRLAILGSTLRPQPTEVKAAIAENLEREVWPALADGRIGPPRIRYFPLAEAVAAHRAMEQPDHFGKIVLLTPFGESLR
jgi:putative PIG3 family NAD(P)H quinone oxidoreductase